MRELAFTRAGIDTTSDLGATLMRGYDGELTTEALQPLAAQMAGLAPPPPPDDTPPEPSALEALEGMSGGMAPGQTPPADVLETAWSSYQSRMAAGARKEDAAAEVVNRVIDAAVREAKGESGYQGFIYNQRDYHDKLSGAEA
jgi:hypothetical protein